MGLQPGLEPDAKSVEARLAMTSRPLMMELK